MRYSKQLRQEIIRDFAERNGGWYDPAAFVAEVRRRGKKHPAYDWFEWDDKEAAKQRRVEQAREFAQGLRVTFRVETVARKDKIVVRTVEMPFVLSPSEQRINGGGYYLTDPADPEHVAEFCRHAADTLEAWARRYQAALMTAGIAPEKVDVLVMALSDAGLKQEAV